MSMSCRTNGLTPEGQTIDSALKKMHYNGVSAVRQGKQFELTLDRSLSRRCRRRGSRTIARTCYEPGPTFEEFSYRLEI